jgi:hypothetical protein
MKTWIELLELMNTKVPVSVIVDDLYGDGFETEFKAGGDNYHFAVFLAFENDGDGDEFEVTFSRLNLGSGPKRALFDVLGDKNLADTLAVFSGVKTSLIKWLKRMEQEGESEDGFRFYFSAKTKDASRAKLYDKFAKIIAKKAKAKLTRSSAGKAIYYNFQKGK